MAKYLVSKPLSLILVAVLFAMSVVPALAQSDQDIVDIAVADGRFTTLVTAVTAADLVDTLKGEGPYTVFAPTDDAFAALEAAAPGTIEGLLNDTPTLSNILLYHVVPGKVMASDVVNLSSAEAANGDSIAISVMDGKVMLNDSAEVIITDIEASNGVIHVIDAVLLPPAEEEAMPAEAEAEMPGQDIVDIAVADGRFTTLVTALTAADLVDTLKGEGPYTVFAPTDDAFAALEASAPGTIEGLLNDVPTLSNILLYHVVPGKVMASDVVNLSSAEAANGDSIAISVMDGKVMLNGNVEVIITDIEASNGVIHVIDGVLLPPAEAPATLPETGAAAPDYILMLLLFGGLMAVAGAIVWLKPIRARLED